MNKAWSNLEVEAVVADYFSMLDQELKGISYSKTSHRRNLAQQLNARSDGSIEFKHQNISAVLIFLGFPYISGYKPRFNYQQLLAEIVIEHLRLNPKLEIVVSEAVEAPSTGAEVQDILQKLVPSPKPYVAKQASIVKETPKNPYRAKVNYLEREAQNASLGLAGEKFILSFERARLEKYGCGSLADRVEHTSVEEGDGAGFDIRSFEIDGTDRLIEVKTTAYGKQTPFFVSRNEVVVSSYHASQYYLYRVFEFRKNPHLFTLNGSLDRVCKLDPVQFIAHLA